MHSAPAQAARCIGFRTRSVFGTEVGQETFNVRGAESAGEAVQIVKALPMRMGPISTDPGEFSADRDPHRADFISRWPVDSFEQSSSESPPPDAAPELDSGVVRCIAAIALRCVQVGVPRVRIGLTTPAV